MFFRRKCTFFEKKCKKIWSCQKKAVLLHPLLKSRTPGAVVQLVRIPACHAVGREFESRPHRKKSTAMWTFLCDGLESREFLSLYVRTIIARAIFESRPHRKERIRKGSFFVLRDSTFSRSLASRHRSYTARSLSTCHPRHVFTSAPQKDIHSGVFFVLVQRSNLANTKFTWSRELSRRC